MSKRKMRWFGRILSGVLTVCLMFSGFSAGQLIVSAGELAGYRNEAVVRFKNVGSGKYLNVHYGYDIDNTNVYQWTGDGSVEQTFRLRYNVEDDGYLIGAMCSSNGNGRVLDVAEIVGQVQAGCNVHLDSATDSNVQQWQFAYQDAGYFTIFPVSSIYTVLTVNGDANGSGNGRDPASAGNVYLSQIPMATYNVQYSEYQLWEIEEVDPEEAPVDEGVYRIVNGHNKYMTWSISGDYAVFQMGDPSGDDTLEAMEEVEMRSHQLWTVTHLYYDYYLISPYTDEGYKLATIGFFDEFEADVIAKPASGTNDTWHNRLQWKFVRNLDGSYRIVSKYENNTQAVTVYQGDTADYTNIQMAPFYDTPGQQWTFVTPNASMCQQGSIAGHTLIELAQTSNSAYYWCRLCQTQFDTPQEQDYDNPYMHDEELALIYALQRLATLMQLEGSKDHFVQACYKATDIIRAQYDNNGFYDMHDRNGNYISPAKYTYDADSVDASIVFEVITYDAEYAAGRGALWEVGASLPFPFNKFVEAYLMCTDKTKTYSVAELLFFASSTVANGALTILGNTTTGLTQDVIKAVNGASTLHSVYSSNGYDNVNHFMEITIEIADKEHRDRFTGMYYVSAANLIHVYKEEYLLTERDWNDAPENMFEGVYIADNGGEYYIDEYLFS